MLSPTDFGTINNNNYYHHSNMNGEVDYKAHPKALIGRNVEKAFCIGHDCFGQREYETFEGSIIGYDPKQQWWRIRYDADQVEEDFSEKQIEKYLVREKTNRRRSLEGNDNYNYNNNRDKDERGVPRLFMDRDLTCEGCGRRGHK